MDESHIIRNDKSLVSKSICGLKGTAKWMITGTPVHNKLGDFFLILKFLNCSPFGDIRVFKTLIEKDGNLGQKRLLLITKSIMLRRLKGDLAQMTSSDPILPKKKVKIVPVQLNALERMVYDAVMAHSKQLLESYLMENSESMSLYLQ